MLDVLYLLGTVAFFGVMLGYVAFCDRLGRTPDGGETPTESRP